MTQGTSVQRAPALAPSLANKTVVDVNAMQQDAQVMAKNLGSSALKRVMMELKQVASGADGIWMHSGEGVHVFPASDDVSFWRVLIEGPQDSPFAGGVFVLSVVVPDNYPITPP